jgi:hypothetical protein
MTRSRIEPDAAEQIALHLLAMHRGEAPAPASASRPEGARPTIDYPRLQHHIRWFDGVLRLYRAAARAVADEVTVDQLDDARESGASDDTEREDDRLMQMIRSAHRILLEHPVAAKQAHAALTAQGRAYAATPEGAELRARLTSSRRLRRASLLWRSVTMGMLDDGDPGELPATYLDNLLRAVDRNDLEQLLGELHLRGASR